MTTPTQEYLELCEIRAQQLRELAKTFDPLSSEWQLLEKAAYLLLRSRVYLDNAKGDCK